MFNLKYKKLNSAVAEKYCSFQVFFLFLALSYFSVDILFFVVSFPYQIPDLCYAFFPFFGNSNGCFTIPRIPQANILNSGPSHVDFLPAEFY